MNNLFINIIQQPIHARQCSGREKIDRRPIDPPPIIQIHGNNENDSSLFISVKLVDKNTLLPIKSNKQSSVLLGNLSQTSQHIKDINNQDMTLVLFQDLSIRLEGEFKLKFELYSINEIGCIKLDTKYCDTFKVYNPKLFPGMMESTLLTRLCASQGVKIRVRMQRKLSSQTIMATPNLNHSIGTSSINSLIQTPPTLFGFQNQCNNIIAPTAIYTTHNTTIPVIKSNYNPQLLTRKRKNPLEWCEPNKKDLNPTEKREFDTLFVKYLNNLF